MRKVLLNLMAVLLVFSIQGCWAGEAKSETPKAGKTMETDLIDIDEGISGGINVIYGKWEPMSSNYARSLGDIIVNDKHISWGECVSVPYEVISNSFREDDHMSYGDSKKEVRRYQDIVIKMDRNHICDQKLNLLSDPPHEVIRFLIPASDPCYADIQIYRASENNDPVDIRSKGTSYNVGGACKK